MIERFAEEGFDGNATYDSIGSGAGFERFCVTGESDVSGASRAIKDSEIESCRSIGREPIEFRLGTDALSVVVSQENDFVTDVTTEELALIFSTAETWSDVRPEWPDEPIQRFIPGTDSGTFDYFVEHVFDEDEGPILAAENTQLSEDDNILVQGVLGSPYAIGFFGYAYYAENTDVLTVLSVDGVEPTQETVDSNEYPLSRPLFHYSDANIIKEKPQVAAYLYFFLTHVNDEINDVGYFPANEAALSGAMDALMAAISGEAMAPAEEPMADMSMYAPDAVSGDVVIAGSSTVFPLAERMIERFAEEGFDGNATYDSIGSGAGFERFCVTGESDVSGASRAIKDSEIESCRSIGREPIEFRLGTDALSVVVSQENDFVTDVTTEELALIFSTAETWADVRPEWPDEPILRFIPGTDSGTFDYFVEHVFDEDEGPILAAENTQLSEDDNILVQGVLGSPYAIGFFGYAYYAENSDVLTVLSVDGVEPTQETVDSNEYPLSRPLFHYTDATILQEKPQVAAYIYFFLTHVNDEIVDVGYFPANEAALSDAMDAWAGAFE
jgi:phosphate binding protein